MTIIYEPAECHFGCDVATCPYMHIESWFVTDGFGNEVGRFYRKQEADRADQEAVDRRYRFLSGQ